MGPAFPQTDRYEAVRLLGRGGMGEVWEARDAETGDRVALKLLPEVSPTALRRFKSEFRLLQDLSHPHLVRMGELQVAAGRWFFTMELVGGTDFVSWARGVQGRGEATPTFDLGALSGESLPTPLPGPGRAGELRLDRLRDALGQLAGALAHLHDRGLVHRDLKPDNVLVTPDGRVVVLDFGLVLEVARGTREVAGTVAWMAPEQAAGQEVVPEADWYAVGVMVFEAITGELPFVGHASRVLMDKQVVPAPPVGSLSPETPPVLAALCNALLRSDPKDRPRGREVLARLGLGDEAAVTRGAPPFTGRRDEMAALHAAWGRSRASGGLLVGEAPSGLGKTALVERFAYEAAARDRRVLVLRSRCHERETAPFKAFDGLVQVLLRLVRPEDPLLHRWGTGQELEGPDQAALDPVERRARLFASLRDLFARVCALRPVMALMDDLQWADADSLALLAELCRQPGAPPAFLVATSRPSEELAARLPASAERLPLGPLSPDDARALAEAWLERHPGAARSREAVVREAGGHPMFIEALARGDAGDLDQTIRVRADSLPPAGRSLLEAVAVAGAPVPQVVVADAAGVAIAQLGSALALLRGLDLVRTMGARATHPVEPFHDRVRVALLAAVPLEERRRLHLRLAEALEEHGFLEPERLAWHLREGGQGERAADQSVLAAEAADRALAFDRAAEHCQAVLDLRAPDHPSRPWTLVLLAEALANAGRGERAARAFLAAVPGAGPDEAFALRRRAGRELLRVGRIDEGLAVFDELMAGAGLRLPASTGAAVLELARWRLHLGLRGLRSELRPDAEVDPALLREIDVCGAAGFVLTPVDTLAGAALQSRALLRALEAGEPGRLAVCLAGEATIVAAEGDLGRAAALLERAREAADRTGDPFSRAIVLHCDACRHQYSGRWAPVPRLTDAAAELMTRCRAVTWEQTNARLISVWGLYFLGEFAELARRVDAGLRDARERDDLYAFTYLSGGMAVAAWLVRDDPAGAREASGESLARWSSRGFLAQHAMKVAGDALTWLCEGRPELAVAALDGNERRFRWSTLMRLAYIRGLFFDLRARVLLASGASPGRVRRDLRRLRQVGQPWTAALADATLARLERDPAALAEAAASLDALDMPAHAAAARWRLGEMTQDAGLGEVSLAVLRRQGVAVPERMFAMLLP